MSEEQAAQVEESAPSEVAEEQAAQVEESAPQEQAAEVQESAPVEEEVVVPDSVQARINTMAKQKHDALREKAELEQRLQQLEQQQEVAPLNMPQLSDPDVDYDDEKLAKKLVVYGQQEGMRAAQEQAKNNAAMQAEMQAQSSYKARVDVFAKDKPDFEASVQQIVPILAGSKQVVDTIMALDNGPEVAYHLSKNPEALDSILTAGVLAGAKLGAISAQLAIKPTPKQTQAPAPTADFSTNGVITDKLSPLLAGVKFE